MILEVLDAIKFVQVPLNDIKPDDMVKLVTKNDRDEATHLEASPYKKDGISNSDEEGKRKRRRNPKPRGRPRKKPKYKFRSIASVKDSLSTMKDLIECNFGLPSCSYLITLTYANKQDSIRRAILDNRNFINSLEVALSCKISYVSKYELGNSHGWHIHCILKSFDDTVELSLDGLAKLTHSLWERGSQVDVRQISSIAGIAEYLCRIDRPTDAYKEYRHLYESKSCRKPEMDIYAEV